MIVKLEQVKTGLKMLWFAQNCDDKNECVVTLPLESGRLNFKFDFADGSKKTLYYNPSDTSFGGSLEERLTYKIFNDNVLEGKIVGRTKKCNGFFQSYAYTHISYENENYYLYEVGLMKEGLFLCLYKDDTLVAIAQKDLIVHDFKDTYTLYILEKKYFKVLMLAIIRYDLSKYGDKFEIAINSKKVKLVKTIQKELLSKYDPTFIPRIKAQNGIKD